MANGPHAQPVGEDAWLALIEEESRAKARDISNRVDILERYKQAVNAEYGSLRIWIAYCDYFWSLYVECNSYANNGYRLSHEEKLIGREIFSLDAALSLWQQGYESVRYRLSDSHELWNRWVALEMELLSSTRTNQGVQRITHLFKNRLQTPHKTWDDTSQMFSTFLSEYNRAEYESTMQDISSSTQETRKIWDDRETFEIKLNRARADGKLDEEKTVMREYLGWEMRQNRSKDAFHQGLLVEICLGLYSRALTGIFSRDDGIWTDYVVWVSSLHTVFSADRSQANDMLRILPNLLNTLQRAVSHCPWAGTLWARYILSAEEAGLSYDRVEQIKHAATSSSQLDRDGMASVIDLYAAWCGFLKRRAMNPNATDEDADVAEIGLTAALEDVQVWGKRLYDNEYKGDPNFRLERILVQYLTEKKVTVDEARNYWNQLAKKSIYADSYNFWLTFYMWEMSIFQTHKAMNGRSPTPASLASRGSRIPTLATSILARAVQRRTLDWPEKLMEIYVQHCNDYEPPEAVRRANDTVHKGLKAVAERRQEEQAAAYSAQMAQYQEQAQASSAVADQSMQEISSKRVKQQDAEAEQQRLKRDRENTSVFVTNLPPPPEGTQTKVRQYFREYGHINNIVFKTEASGQSAVALIEFATPEELQSALLRDGKYFGQQQITVLPATGTTLYVTNYPPLADDSFIRNLFKDCGEIFSIRWPSLQANSHRRFCYATFRDAEGAAKATRLDGKLLEGKYKLVAKYSDPQNKKNREGPQEEGREVHVTNVPEQVTEAELKTMFEKYGTVQRVRILVTKTGHSRGSAFVVFQTKEQAQEAVAELNQTKLRNNILKVEKSVAKNFKPVSRAGPSMSPSPGPSGAKDTEGDNAMLDYDDEKSKPKESKEAGRTFALMGLPDTMNDARVQALVEAHGQLAKLTLRHDHGGAILEFVDAAAAGKAQLSLDGIEVEDRKLKTGSVSELFQEKGEVRIDRVDQKPAAPAPAQNSKSKVSSAMMPPPSTMIRRPVLGSKGQKRGLGFSGVINKEQKAEPSSSAPTTNGENGVASGTSSGGMKSNADFRTLLLGSGPKKDDGAPSNADTKAVDNGGVDADGKDN
ncbi:hypothetical protein KVR01_001337 [Diaporthe batatas]|uniref:U6 snRNP complex subunit PRP24 n=1 Tax=Diaporthe batatas TaxID=748121 RepID=UPI001D055C5F|nr:U6 snRNP complex subunit PRP24 [Diaporthe batatas]KAG8168588.1 hypothetical protein KVR01_001337 [Diaporthe batatas]